jgi:ribosome recycling factor
MKTTTEAARQAARDLNRATTRLAIATVRLQQMDELDQLMAEFRAGETKLAEVDTLSKNLDKRFDSQVKRVDDAGADMRRAISKL